MNSASSGFRKSRTKLLWIAYLVQLYGTYKRYINLYISVYLFLKFYK